MYLKQTGWEGMVLINLNQHKEKWQAVERMVMNLCALLNCGEYVQ
jgi:hypothetical protein